MRLSDRISVLRGGSVVRHIVARRLDASREQLLAAMMRHARAGRSCAAWLRLAEALDFRGLAKGATLSCAPGGSRSTQAASLPARSSASPASTAMARTLFLEMLSAGLAPLAGGSRPDRAGETGGGPTHLPAIAAPPRV